MERGAFVTFEGLDGSGKSTHLARVALQLSERGFEVVRTHEPGGTALGDAIRGIFLDPRWGPMDGRVELLLVAASRRQHLIEIVEPAVQRGAIVLCDRFSDSTFAYQGYGRGVDLELLAAADRVATGGLLPDLTLLFDLPAAAARQRGQSPRRRARRGIDRLDAEELAFYERVRDGFLVRAAGAPERFRVIDSSGERAETERQVVAALDSFLAERREAAG